ncbi:hypothetical protein [Lysobacter sp. F60174L2]|uniref:hypothetical protein n=1 Tax=Lysobacter sp. F60174L2 TaxID=3459295 RepID=UPI00403DB6E1
MQLHLFLASALLALFVASPASAQVGDALSFDEVRTQQAEIRADAGARRGVYENLSERQHRQLEDRQHAVLRMIEGKQSPRELSEPQRMDLFNQLEAIEALVNQAEDQRMVCERVATIGSNRKQRVCKTVAQRREEMRGAQHMLNQGSNCTGCSE